MKRISGPERVQEALSSFGLTCRVQSLPASTRTAKEAAEAIGCSLGQIVKSLIFNKKKTNVAVLVVMSGSNRVDLDKLARLCGEIPGKANADFVREHSGFSIGGVAPLAHPKPLETYLDEDLFQFETAWAAAGSPNSVFEIEPQDLLNVTGATRADIKESMTK